MPPPSWLTALCGPAAPILTCIFCSSARAAAADEVLGALARRRPRPGRRAASSTGASACPTRSPTAPTRPPPIGAAVPRRAPTAGSTRSSRPARAAPPSPRPCSASGRSTGVRRPALTAILPGGGRVRWSCSTSAPACRSARSTWSSTPRSAPPTRGWPPGSTHPRVGLLSVGAEPGKGDRLRRATDAALRVQPPAIGSVRRAGRGARRGPRRAGRRGGHRRLHRKRAAQGDRGGAGRGARRVPARPRCPGPPRCSAWPARWWSATAPPAATTSPRASRWPPAWSAAPSVIARLAASAASRSRHRGGVMTNRTPRPAIAHLEAALGRRHRTGACCRWR